LSLFNLWSRFKLQEAALNGIVGRMRPDYQSIRMSLQVLASLKVVRKL
jgi:hypothetical protein